MLDAEHMHRTALALGNTGLASGQLGHDDLWVDTIGEHVAMVAIAGDDAVLVAVERRLQPDRDGFLSDIEVAEAADQAETIELARLLLETADQQHFAIEDFEFLRRRLIGRGVAGRLAVRLRSEEHTSELQSPLRISYAV